MLETDYLMLNEEERKLKKKMVGKMGIRKKVHTCGLGKSKLQYRLSDD